MTRAERLAKQEQRTLDDLARVRKRLAQVAALRRRVDQKARNQRYWLVGKLADEMGLLVWSDATLAALFAVLARLSPAPDPVKVLDGLLNEN